MASVGFCVVSTTKRGYPLEDATHIAFSETHTCYTRFFKHTHTLRSCYLPQSHETTFINGPVCDCLTFGNQQTFGTRDKRFMIDALLIVVICQVAGVCLRVNRNGAQVPGEPREPPGGRCVRRVGRGGGVCHFPNTATALAFVSVTHLNPLFHLLLYVRVIGVNLFCVSSQPVYRKLLPLYFPRSEEEEKAFLPLLPGDIGNSEGEPVVPERQIRIAEKPGTLEGTRAFI